MRAVLVRKAESPWTRVTAAERLRINEHLADGTSLAVQGKEIEGQHD